MGCSSRNVCGVLIYSALIQSACASITSFGPVGVSLETPASLASFGALAGATVSVSVRALSTSEDPKDSVIVSLFQANSLTEFLLLTTRSTNYRPYFCTFPSALRFEVPADGSETTLVGTIGSSERYILAALHCSDGTATVTGTATFLNVGMGSKFAHLSAQSAGLPMLFVMLCGTYVVLVGVWGVLCWKRRTQLSSVHAMLTIPLLTKLFMCAANAMFAFEYGVHGISRSPTQMLAAVVTSLDSAAFFIIMLLLGMGWRYTRPVITRREVIVMVLLGGMYCLSSILDASCNDEEKFCTAYALTEYIVRTLLSMAVIVSFNFQVASLRALLRDPQWSPETPKHYKTLTTFQNLRWTFLAYFFVPPMLTIMRISITDWTHEWLREVLYQFTFVIVFILIGYEFRPVEDTDFVILTKCLDGLQDRQRQVLPDPGTLLATTDAENAEVRFSGTSSASQDDVTLLASGIELTQARRSSLEPEPSSAGRSRTAVSRAALRLRSAEGSGSNLLSPIARSPWTVTPEAAVEFR
jgi:hypothetical protein